MKTIFALLIIALVSSSHTVLAKNNTIIAGIEMFLEGMGLTEVDDLIENTIAQNNKIQALIAGILKDWADSPMSWIETSDAISKVGDVMDTVASYIRDNANNTSLNQQLNSVANYFNDIVKDPVYFQNKVISNISANSMQLMWAAYDLKALLDREDYIQFGTRFSQVLTMIIKDAVRPRSLRSLNSEVATFGKSFREISKLKIFDCIRQSFSLVWEVVRVAVGWQSLDFAEFAKLAQMIFDEVKICFIGKN